MNLLRAPTIDARLLAVALTAIAAVCLALLVTGPTGAGGPIVVTNADDPGNGNCDAQCTLREAIEVANGTAGNDTITFAPGAFPPGNPSTISVASALPASTDPAGVTVDGTGAGVIIDGGVLSGSENGLSFYTSAGVALQDVTVRGIMVQNFPGDGINVCAGDAASCDGELIDALVEVVSSSGNGDDGIVTFGAPNTRSRVAGSSASNNGGDGIALNAGAVTNLVDAVVEQAIAEGNGERGISLIASGDNVGAIVEGSSAMNNPGGGININAGDGTIDPTVTGSTAMGNGDGIVLNGGAPSSGASVSDNVSTGNTGDGISTDTSGTYADNTLSNNGGDGFEVRELAIVIESNTISGNTAHGIEGNYGGLTISGNTITGNLSTAGAVLVSGTQNVVNRNTIAGNAGDGIDGGFSGSGEMTVTNNMVDGNGGDGIVTGPAGNSTVEANAVLGNAGTGIYAGGSGDSVHFSRIVGNGTGLTYGGAGTLDAENNWWGCNEGPGQAGCDTTSGSVDADPWLVLEIEAPTPTVVEDDGVPLFGRLTMNSDGENTAGLKHVPDGTEVLFETDLGSVGSPSVVKELEEGSASATYTADGGPGTANVSLTLDNETVTLPLTVTPGATETPGPTATPTATPSSTPAPTVTATPVPSETPGPKGLAGDMDCDGDVDSVDALALLRFVAGLPPLGQTEACDDVGSAGLAFGDLDCDGDIDAVDALAVLRFVAGLSPLAQQEPCTDVGS